MSQNPGQWGPQGQGGYPPQQGQGGYPTQPMPAYGQQPGGYNPQGGYAPQGGYPPQGPPGGYGPQLPPGGYGQQPGGGGYPPSGGQPGKRNPGLIIGIVVAAVVLLAAIGGIVMVLNRDSTDRTSDVSITPTASAPPTTEPTPAPTPSGASTPTNGPQPTPSDTGAPPTGDAIDLGNGIGLTPAAGWEVQKTNKGIVQLSNGRSVFLGQVIQAEAKTNPGQLCDAWHRKVGEDTSNGKYQDPKSVDPGTDKLSADTCLAQVTVSNGQGSTTVLLFSLVSVRTTDGLTVIGTASFPESVDAEQLNKDFTVMVNSMLDGQASG